MMLNQRIFSNFNHHHLSHFCKNSLHKLTLHLTNFVIFDYAQFKKISRHCRGVYTKRGTRNFHVPLKYGAPDRNRTCGLQLRRLSLYPTELRAQSAFCSNSLGSCQAEVGAAVKAARGTTQKLPLC